MIGVIILTILGFLSGIALLLILVATLYEAWRYDWLFGLVTTVLIMSLVLGLGLTLLGI